MSFISNGTLSQEISDLVAYWNTFNTEYTNWLGGTVDGGPSADGLYPLTNYLGSESLVACPALLSDNVSGYVATVAASAAAAAADLVLTNADVVLTNADVVTATAQAVLADADRVAAEAAETSAINEAVTAVAQANLATLRAGYAEEWAITVEDTLVSAAAGGNEVDEYSALHWAAKSGGDATATAADAVSTAADAVSTAADVVTTGDFVAGLTTELDELDATGITDGYVLTADGANAAVWEAAAAGGDAGTIIGDINLATPPVAAAFTGRVRIWDADETDVAAEWGYDGDGAGVVQSLYMRNFVTNGMTIFENDNFSGTQTETLRLYGGRGSSAGQEAYAMANRLICNYNGTYGISDDDPPLMVTRAGDDGQAEPYMGFWYNNIQAFGASAATNNPISINAQGGSVNLGNFSGAGTTGGLTVAHDLLWQLRTATDGLVMSWRSSTAPSGGAVPNDAFFKISSHGQIVAIEMGARASDNSAVLTHEIHGAPWIIEGQNEVGNPRKIGVFETTQAVSGLYVGEVNQQSSLWLWEETGALTNQAGWGQIYVKTGTPNTLWFNDDAGTDFQLGLGGSHAHELDELDATGITDGYVLTADGAGAAAWEAAAGGGLANIVEDVTPQLGATLDANTFDIDMGTNVLTDTALGQFITAYGWGDWAATVALKAPLASPTFTGTANAAAVTISGALTVNGTVVGDSNTTVGLIKTIEMIAAGNITKTSHGNYLYHKSADYDNDQNGEITFSTSTPSGGTTGDIWFEYTA